MRAQKPWRRRGQIMYVRTLSSSVARGYIQYYHIHTDSTTSTNPFNCHIKRRLPLNSIERTYI